MCGVPVQRIIDGDDVERALWLRVTARAGELKQQLMRAQASHNASQIARLYR